MRRMRSSSTRRSLRNGRGGTRQELFPTQVLDPFCGGGTITSQVTKNTIGPFCLSDILKIGVAMPKFTLSKTACMWSGEGPGENFDHPVRYEIGGMPAGRVAHIEMSGHASDRWRIQCARHDAQACAHC